MKLHRFFRTPPSWLKKSSNLLLPDELLRRKLLGNLIRTVEQVNVSRKPREKMDPALRKRLKKEMAPEISRLSDLIDRDLSIWA